MGKVKTSLLHRESVYRSAINTFGHNLQFVQLREEIAELQLAMARYERCREDISSVVEEVADVTIMVAQARLMLGPEVVDAVIEMKLERLVNTISAVQAGGRSR